MHLNKIESILFQSIRVKQQLLANTTTLQTIERVVELCTNTFRNAGKLLFCGNGGSASDSLHLAAEFSGRFYKDRAPLFAEALNVNIPYLTAVANDYGYNEVFARILQAKGREGDVLFALSTSGNSPNIVRALEVAANLKIITVGFTGQSGGKMSDSCDYIIQIPSLDTPRIQECHITVGHIICELVEASLF